MTQNIRPGNFVKYAVLIALGVAVTLVLVAAFGEGDDFIERLGDSYETIYNATTDRTPWTEKGRCGDMSPGTRGVTDAESHSSTRQRRRDHRRNGFRVARRVSCGGVAVALKARRTLPIKSFQPIS